MTSATAPDDYEVRRAVWDSRVPVEFVLDPGDQLSLLHRGAGLQQSTFVQLPRVSYFPVQLARHLQHLLLVAGGGGAGNVDGQEVWLQSLGRPLKWHYPIGVLFDLYNGANTNTLPWQVTIRLKDFPDELVRCSSKEALRACFIQSVKEADHVKHKSKVVYTMNAQENARLFDGLWNDRFDDFWSVNQRLMANPATDQENGSRIINVPIRFYTQTADSPSGGISFRQAPVQPGLRLDEATRLALGPEASEGLEQRLEPVSHGVVLPWSTPALWLATNLAYPDNFVHVVLRPLPAGTIVPGPF